MERLEVMKQVRLDSARRVAELLASRKVDRKLEVEFAKWP